VKIPTLLVGLMVVAGVIQSAPAMSAKDAPSYDKGVLLSMDSKACGAAQNSGKSLTEQLIGGDAEHKKVQEVLCQEYVLQADRITYRIRPKDDKHAILLPVGDTVQFRISKDKMYLRNPEGGRKEREYKVISMQPRADVKEARNAP
jgi:D-serine deaminase-like pyridoxal phosphate-dependent protein